jgi:hypothetical protein
MQVWNRWKARKVDIQVDEGNVGGLSRACHAAQQHLLLLHKVNKSIRGRDF